MSRSEFRTSTPEVAEYVDQLYQQIIVAGTHKADSIKIAEAAKVIENTQRDLNIALVNELALIFNRLGIDTEARNMIDGRLRYRQTYQEFLRIFGEVNESVAIIVR